MTPAARAEILDILEHHDYLTLATIREDGFPQATTVGYVNDGLTLYVAIGAESQKARNIRHCNKVSLTVDDDEKDWNRIHGLSMAATAEIVSGAKEINHVGELMYAKFPQAKDMEPPTPDAIAILKIEPRVISVLDYSKGFGHTELVEV